MEGYDASTYGDRIAGIYDELYQELFDVEGTADLLAEVAEGGPALELAIGTGRIALPLKERGIEVHGVDISEAMVEKLRAKPGGADIPVTMGNFAEVPVYGEYPLVYLVFNTLFALTTQEEQISCFANVAAHLAPGGVFVIECFWPDIARFDRHQRIGVDRITRDSVSLETTRHDPVNQRSESLHVVLKESGTELYPVIVRYAYPSELDLMARLAGLRLRDRFGGWRKQPFTSDSPSHVSIYEKPA
jgi:SAM-dependent methyltransferase